MFYYMNEQRIIDNIFELKELPEIKNNVSFGLEITKESLKPYPIRFLVDSTKPSFNIDTEYIKEIDPIYDELNDVYVRQYIVEEYTEEELNDLMFSLKEYKLSMIASSRYNEECAGIQYLGYTIKTDRESQATLNGALSAVLLDPDIIIRWKASDNEWIELNSEQIKELSTIVYRHVQILFYKEYELSTLIKNSSSISELNSIEW